MADFYKGSTWWEAKTEKTLSQWIDFRGKPQQSVLSNQVGKKERTGQICISGLWNQNTSLNCSIFYQERSALQI